MKPAAAAALLALAASWAGASGLPASAPRGWELLQRAARTHGHDTRWNRIRDWKLQLTRTWFDEHGRPDRSEDEVQWLLKGRRTRLRLETPTDAGWRVFGLDGRRSWVTVNGYRVRGEVEWSEAAYRTRWQAFLARLPFVLREKDARSTLVGHGVFQGRPTLVVEVRFVGGTRPVEETLRVHLDASTYRLVRLDFDHPTRTPGSHYRLEFEDFSSVEGVLVPFTRRTFRSDGALFQEERVKGIRVNQDPPEYWFANPVRLPDHRRGAPQGS